MEKVNLFKILIIKNFMVKHKFIKNLIISNDGINFKTIIPNINLSHIAKDSQVCPVNGIVVNNEKIKYIFIFKIMFIRIIMKYSVTQYHIIDL